MSAVLSRLAASLYELAVVLGWKWLRRAESFVWEKAEHR